MNKEQIFIFSDYRDASLIKLYLIFLGIINPKMIELEWDGNIIQDVVPQKARFNGRTGILVMITDYRKDSLFDICL